MAGRQHGLVTTRLLLALGFTGDAVDDGLLRKLASLGTIDRLKNSALSKIVVTNTLPLPDDRRIDKIEVLSVAGIIGDALDAVFEDQSVSEIFGGANQA